MMWISKKNIAEFEIRIGEINYGGHMGNDKSLQLFHDARIKFLESLGFSEKYIGDNAGIIMSEAHVYFIKEVFLHDVLSVDIAVSDITTSSMVINYRVVRINDNVEVLHGSTKLIAFDYNRKRVTRIPGEFLDKIAID